MLDPVPRLLRRLTAEVTLARLILRLAWQLLQEAKVESSHRSSSRTTCSTLDKTFGQWGLDIYLNKEGARSKPKVKGALGNGSILHSSRRRVGKLTLPKAEAATRPHLFQRLSLVDLCPLDHLQTIAR